MTSGAALAGRGYQAIRHGVGGRWVERDFLAVEGPEAGSWLQGQLSQDVEALGPGGSADSLLLSPRGKLEALLRVTRWDRERFVLDVEGGFGDRVVDRLQRFKLRVKAEMSPLEWRCLSLRGPGAREAAGSVTTDDPPWLALPADWPGLAGADLVGTAGAVPDEVVMCEPEEWEAARVEAGIPLMGAELDDSTIAPEAGLNERAVSSTKGCYTGQELLARLEARGNRVSRRLLGLSLGDVSTPPRGAEVYLAKGDKPVGQVTSAARSPTRGEVVALAYLRREVDPASGVVLRWDGDEVRARVEELPLVN